MTALTWTKTPQKQEWRGGANGVELYRLIRRSKTCWTVFALWPATPAIRKEGRHILNVSAGNWPLPDFEDLEDAKSAAEADLAHMLDLPRRAGLIVDAEPAAKAEKLLAQLLDMVNLYRNAVAAFGPSDGRARNACFSLKLSADAAQSHMDERKKK